MIQLTSGREGIFLRASVWDACNFSCQYCPKDLGMENHTPVCMKTPVLSPEAYIRNMGWIAKHGFRIISFTGGEPLLNPNFPQILKGCRELFDTIEITTNGTRLPEMLDVIRDNVDVLKISLDAYDPELSVGIARSPAAANTLQIVEKCCQAGIKKIGLNFVYMKQNQGELPKLVQFAKRLRQTYQTEVYISLLDLYYSAGNRQFWEEQFVNLSGVRKLLEVEGKVLHHRLRIGCDSYNFLWDDVPITMKDSISCTHRADMCEICTEYCQEGIYSLKHSASGWVSVCPSNNPKLGALIDRDREEKEAHTILDGYVGILNVVRRVEQTGRQFAKENQLEAFYE